MDKFLIIFYEKDGEFNSVFIPVEDDDDNEALIRERILMLGLTKEDSIKIFYRELENCQLPEFYISCLALKEGELIFDRSHIIELHFSIWIPQREDLFKGLDLLFMRYLEEGDEKKLKNITMQKKFLRDLPNFILMKFAEAMGLKDAYTQRDENGNPIGIVDSFDAFSVSQQIAHRDSFNKKYTIIDAMEYTPYYNILDIEVVDGGSGYTEPPTIEFSCKRNMVFPPKCETVIENGKLKEVKVITAGCGFMGEYYLTISLPELKTGTRAKVEARIYNDTKHLLKLEDFNYPSYEL